MLRSIEIDAGKLSRELAIDADALASATQTVVRRTTTTLKNALRRQVVRQGLGQRLANTIRSVVTARKGVLRDIEGRVFSKAKVRVGSTGERTDLITLFDEGATIQAFRRKFLAIPLAAAGRGPRGRKARPADFQGDLIAKVNGDSGVLVHKSNPNVPLFALVRSVHLKKRLDIDGAYQRATKDIEEKIGREWERRRVRAAARIAAAA